MKMKCLIVQPLLLLTVMLATIQANIMAAEPGLLLRWPAHEGGGVQVQDINKLIKMHQEMERAMKQIKKMGGLKGLASMFGGGGLGAAMPGAAADMGMGGGLAGLGGGSGFPGLGGPSGPDLSKFMKK